MKSVKYRDGFNGQGGMDATFLDRSSAVPFLKKRRADGAGGTIIAHKRGQFLEVTREGQALDGFYSVGEIDGELRVVGSATARGRFNNRGVFAGDGDLVGVTAILNYGRGLGFDQSAEFVGTSEDFDGKACNVFDVTIHRTRNGRQFVPFYSYLAAAPFDAATFFSYLFGEVYGPAGARKAFNNHAYMSLDGAGQHFIAFVRDDGTTQTLGATLTAPNQLAAAARVNRMAPGSYVMMTKYLRPSYVGSSVVVADCPGLDFTFSADAGETWSTASATELFAEFFDTVQTLPESGYTSKFNQAVTAANINVAPRGAGLGIAHAVVPYAAVDPELGPEFQIYGKVKLGIVNSASRTLLGTVTLFDGSLTEAVAFWEGGCVGVDGGAVIVTKPVSGTGVAGLPEVPAQILFTPDAGSVVASGPMPQPNYKTGIVTALAPNLLVCPMYDGQHSLFESRDRGVTWQKRAVLTDQAAAPVVVPEVRRLLEFGVLTFLRRNNEPANSTPGTPWASDSRIAAPIF